MIACLVLGFTSDIGSLTAYLNLHVFLFFYSPFPGMLSQFPPTTVRLKLPFSIKPWTGSEDNVGKLLMVMLYSSYSLTLFFLLFGHFLRD